MTIQQAYQQLLLQLYDLYDNREAANITNWIIENVTGFRKIDRLTNKNFSLNNEQQQQFELYSLRLMQHQPVQYVLREAWFAEMKLYVDERVLIPRPETEELVEWVVESKAAFQETEMSLLDIGTGSGCIPIAIKKKLPSCRVSAIDVSSGALEVARKNAAKHEALITFHQLDFLNGSSWPALPTFNIIVSNPPYIKESEAAAMHKNVLNYEPHLALFVADNDALIFYKKIAEFGKKHLEINGAIFLEINEVLGQEVLKLFEAHHYGFVEIRKDMQGKDRMVRVMK